MKVEIWSDVVCPFCYIGKRKFENALQQFTRHQDVEIVWRSFQLDPHTSPAPGKSVAESLAEKKGLSLQQVQQMNDHVNKMAREVGLNYQLDKAVIANTLDAHRLLHLAAAHKLQNEAEERLFTAYMMEGKDIGDKNTLLQLGLEIGLPQGEVQRVLESDAYTYEVQRDQYEAQQVGAHGVPFFVFNNRYAVSGAQPSEVFLEVLEKVWQEDHPANNLNADGAVCTPEGICH